MGKLSVLSLSFASSLWLSSGFTQDIVSAPQPPYLSQEQVANTTFVSDWLEKHGSTADQKQSQWFFNEGLRQKQRGNWSAASKAFGESMVRYPGPQALTEYAQAELRMLRGVRSRENSIDANSRRIWRVR